MLYQTAEFKQNLNKIIDFIAKDSVQNALHFRQDLLHKLQNLDFMPYKFRKSKSFEDENIRDFIFKGFVVPYLIYKNDIYVLNIFKENLYPKA